MTGIVSLSKKWWQGQSIKFIILIDLRKERKKDTNATVTSTRDGDQI
jgi:hypothetical protein